MFRQRRLDANLGRGCGQCYQNPGFMLLNCRQVVMLVRLLAATFSYIKTRDQLKMLLENSLLPGYLNNNGRQTLLVHTLLKLYSALEVDAVLKKPLLIVFVASGVYSG
jgi:hypothetical protein